MNRLLAVAIVAVPLMASGQATQATLPSVSSSLGNVESTLNVRNVGHLEDSSNLFSSAFNSQINSNLVAWYPKYFQVAHDAIHDAIEQDWTNDVREQEALFEVQARLLYPFLSQYPSLKLGVDSLIRSAGYTRPLASAEDYNKALIFLRPWLKTQDGSYLGYPSNLVHTIESLRALIENVAP